MSEPTYRIEVTHEPSSPDDSVPYIARAYRISGEIEYSAWGTTADLALASVRGMMRMQIEPPVTVYADARGNLIDVPDPESLRV